MDYAIIGYPVSNCFKSKFEHAIGGVPAYLDLAELRRLSVPRMLATLAVLPARRIYVLLEDEASEPILPILKALAACSRARSLEIVHADQQRERFSRLSLLPLLSAVGWATISGQRNVRASERDCDWLLGQPRIDVKRQISNHVLYLKTNFWFGLKAGGSIGHVAGVVNGLLSKGMEVDYIAPGKPVMIDPEASVCTLVTPRHYGLPVEANLYRFGRSVVSQSMRFVAEKQYSFIYQRMSVGDYSGVMLSRKLQLPLVLEYNGSEVWVQSNWGRAMRYAKTAAKAEDVCLKHAHQVVTVSDVLRDELIERGVESRRIVSYPNGIDPRIFDPARYSNERKLALKQKLGLAPDSLVALFLGTFGRWHGTDVLAQAVRKLALEQPEWLRKCKLHFVFVGDGLMMPTVRETLADRRCESFYTLTGLVPQAESPEYLGMADLLLSPHVPNADGSRFFGSPTKLFEYMAMEKGIIASDLDQIGEVLHDSLRMSELPNRVPTDHETTVALLTVPGHVEQLVEGIKFLINNPRWRDVLGRNSRRCALAKYSWLHHVQEILDGIDRIAPSGQVNSSLLHRAA